MSRKIIRGGVTRRGLMQGAAAGAVLLGTGVGRGFAAEGPKRGGTLRVGKGHGSTSDSLDPGTWSDGYTTSQGFAAYAYLTEIDAGGDVAPNLAESWEPTPDAVGWTFKLRKASFHDGSPITAKDVVASINHHRGEDSQSAAKPLVAPIKDIKADGDDAVVFTLDSGNADFPFIMSDYHLPIGKAGDDGKVEWSAGIGSGAYVLKNFEPGVRSDLERFDGYWRNDRAWFDKIELLSIIDPVARQNALMTGSVDAIDRVDVQTVDLLKRNPKVKIVTLTGTQHYVFPMRAKEAPFTDVNVRQAMKYAIKRQEMLDKILKGYGALGNDIPLSRNQRFFDDQIPQREYDPDKSKWYLKQAGMDSLDVTLYTANTAFAGAVDAAQLFAASAAPAGITVKVERAADDGYWSNIWNVKPFCASYWSGRPTADQMFSTAYKCDAPWNDTAWCNERFDELLVKARAELDEEKRREMYYEMQEILHNDGGLIAPMFASYVDALSDRIGHDEMASNWDMDGERWATRWWFKD